MPAKLPEGLNVWAVDHDDEHPQTISEVISGIRELNGNRTLFIELSQKWYGIDSRGIFSQAVKAALKKRWRVVFLDRDSIQDLGGKTAGNRRVSIYYNAKSNTSATQTRMRNAQLVESYVNANLREKDWVRRIVAHHAIQGDVIILHPVHISGFLTESGLSSANVKKFQFRGGKPVDLYHKLSEPELAAFAKWRNALRKRRQMRRIKRKNA